MKGDLMSTIMNGVDVDKLGDLVNTIRTEPDKAKVNFSATTQWVNGAQSYTKVRDFVLEADEPTQLVGTNKHANPVEFILAALGSCLVTGFAYNAAIRGINLESLEISLEGNLDLRGFLGVSDKVRPGYQAINVRCKVKSNATREKITELCEHVVKTSPVRDIIQDEEPVTITVED
jgi:uncharacterized OsmC-like protein